MPKAAIMLQAGAAILLIAFSTLKDLLSYLEFTLSLSVAVTVFYLFLIKRTEAGKTLSVPDYPFRLFYRRDANPGSLGGVAESVRIRRDTADDRQRRGRLSGT